MERAITADRLTDHLDGLVAAHRTPAMLRYDNGPGFVSVTMADWAGIRSLESPELRNPIP